MSQQSAELKSQKEAQMLLAIEAVVKKQISTLKAAAAAYDVPYSTLKHRFGRRAARADITANCQKLNKAQELSLVKWVLDMDQRGLPSTQHKLQEMANILLSDAGDFAPVWPNWVTRFVKRHPNLSSKYTRKYDSQRSQCESLDVMKKWFALVEHTIKKYDIQEQNIYNFDESGFQMGVASTAKIVTGSHHKSSKVPTLQPGNREWVTVIECVNATGWACPPMVIFAGKVHQSPWYQDIPQDWSIGLSSNGWTNNELGMVWLKDVLNRHTSQPTVGKYRLLVLDGHGSHATAEFDHFCKSHQIIPLYMPAHPSHHLQPLDVSCFAPLKQLYGQEVQTTIQNGINHIDKSSFLALFQQARNKALSSGNIRSGFDATGLVPFNPKEVLQKLDICTEDNTPPNSPHASPWAAKTPKTTFELQKQPSLVKYLVGCQSETPSKQAAIDQLGKACETTMHEALMLRQQIAGLQEANKRQKKKREELRSYIATGGVLTGGQGHQLSQETQVRADPSISRKRAAPQCSKCHTVGHMRTRCPNELI